MSAHDHGGPAFPCHSNPMPGKLIDAPQGMTLRDYFAAMAMQGLLVSHATYGGQTNRFMLAQEAYAHADAMLDERRANVPGSAA